VGYSAGMDCVVTVIASVAVSVSCSVFSVDDLKRTELRVKLGARRGRVEGHLDCLQPSRDPEYKDL